MTENQPDPLQEMINQLNDMVRLVKEKKFEFSDEPLPPGIDEMITDLESQVKMFCQITDETLKELGISKEEVQQRLESPPKTMSVTEKKNIKMINHLKMEVDEIKWFLGEAVRVAKETGASSGMTEKDKKGKRHKDRYKRLGGDSKWKSV